MTTLTEPMPFAAALERLRSKVPVGSPLRTHDWSQMPQALRNRALFSAAVESAKVVSTIQQKLEEALSLSSRAEGRAFMDRSKFVAEMREALGAAPGDTGMLTDLTSGRRLGLIYDFQLEDAREYGRMAAGQDPDILEAFPCQELIRVESREVPRDWARRWQEAGGRFFDGRMIARKDDPIWEKISRFGKPWPPFDFGSGMGLEDVDRDEAIALGVIPADATVSPTLPDFNERMEAQVPAATPAILEGFRELFGDQVSVGADGRIAWTGEGRG